MNTKESLTGAFSGLMVFQSAFQNKKTLQIDQLNQ